ncbi:hypothetical protein F8324_20180 [Salmonella enterica]|nr:hypothetical protein [Salmonella enterica]
MENQVFKNLQIAVFREQLMNIKNHNNIIDIVDTMKDKVSFDILIYHSVIAYMSKVELLALQYSHYIETKKSITDSIKNVRDFICAYEKKRQKKVKDMDYNELKERQKYKEFKRNISLIDNMSDLYSGNDKEFYHEIAEQLKRYDDLIYYLLEHKDCNLTDDNFISLIEDMKKFKGKRKMSNEIFESLHTKYITILSDRVLHLVFENEEPKLKNRIKGRV